MKKNERKRRAVRREKVERATISMPEKLMEGAVEKAQTIRPYTLSNYIAGLIEKDLATA